MIFRINRQSERRPHHQVNCADRTKPVRANSCAGGGRSHPSRHGGGPEAAQGRSGNQVTLDVEEIVDGAMGGNEALSLPLGFEALHLCALVATPIDLNSRLGYTMRLVPVYHLDKKSTHVRTFSGIDTLLGNITYKGFSGSL